jgi:hypothetical protein
MSTWFIGIASGLFGILLASRGLDIGIEIFGCGLFAFGILMVFLLMKKEYDAAEAKRARAAQAPAE